MIEVFAPKGTLDDVADWPKAPLRAAQFQSGAPRLRFEMVCRTLRSKGMRMKRRESLALLGGFAVAWPVLVSAQQPAMPVVGYLSGGSPNEPYNTAFRRGLSEGGYVEGQNVAIISHWAEGHYDRLPALAADLVGRGVAAIFAEGGSVTGRTAKQATTTIPIVFLNGDDPVNSGLVSSISRPEGNVTGVSVFTAALGPKKLELLREIVPRPGVFGVLMNSGNRTSEAEAANVAEAARAMGQELQIVGVSSEDDIERAFATFASRQAVGLLVTTGVFFGDNKQRIIALAARYTLPAIYDRREFAAQGGLISYGTNFVEVFRQAGTYVARVLKGEKPADLPVLLPTKFELVINLKTAKTLGVAIPQMLQATADEVIE
jgi:putative tryptophan/tyrosine transport system substrate-binding protein